MHRSILHECPKGNAFPFQLSYDHLHLIAFEFIGGKICLLHYQFSSFPFASLTSPSSKKTTKRSKIESSGTRFFLFNTEEASCDWTITSWEAEKLVMQKLNPRNNCFPQPPLFWGLHVRRRQVKNSYTVLKPHPITKTIFTTISVNFLSISVHVAFCECASNSNQVDRQKENRIIKLFRLENTFKIIKSITKLHLLVPVHVSEISPGMETPPPAWAACSNA